MEGTYRRAPRRIGMGFLLAAVLALTPAHADNVSVSLAVDLGYPPAVAAKAACTVTVASGAKGRDVLDAAKAKGCITSYDTIVFNGKHFVSCIDEICQLADGLATYWRMTVDDAYVCYGVDDFAASAGKRLGFAYTPSATFVLDPAC
jgi:hypothetical protein